MPAGNNNFVDTDAKIKDFLNAVLSSEGIVVDIRRTFINYNGVNRSRVFVRRANEMASKGGNEKFVVIALMCYPALQWILQAQDIDRLVEELREQNPDESVSRMSNIQRVLESSLGGCKPQLRLEMRKVFFARCQQLVDAVDEAMNAAVFHNPKSKAGKISLAMALLRGSILETDPVTAVTIRTHFDSIIEDVAAMAGDTIKPLVMQLAPNEGNTLHGSDGSEVEKTVSKDDSWADVMFEDLPVYQNGQKVTYTLTESTVDGYTTDIRDNGHTFTVTNTHIPAVVNVDVTKVWTDGENQDGNRPDSISVILTGNDGNRYTATITAANNWKYTFSKLPKFFNEGTQIEYTLAEDAASGYSNVIEKKDNYTFVLTNKYSPATVDIPVVKKWNDDNDRDGARPESVNIVLNGSDGKLYTGTLSAENGYAD